MSLCDRCFAPGACCRRMYLSIDNGQPMTFWADRGREGVIEQLRERGLPFLPLEELARYTDAEAGDPTLQS